jgi:hypothetical protein
MLAGLNRNLKRHNRFYLKMSQKRRCYSKTALLYDGTHVGITAVKRYCCMTVPKTELPL